jgi:hypothetical protein
LLRQFG